MKSTELKASDLRIGNYVKFGKLFKKVVEISQDGFYVLDKDGTTLKSTWADLQPIPLTEDILLKCGFQKISTNYEKGFLLLWGNLKTGTIDFVLIEPHSNIRHVTALSYLHQLQNLYFALTNEELEIKL